MTTTIEAERSSGRALSGANIRSTAAKLLIACDQVASFEGVNLGWDERGPYAQAYERRICKESIESCVGGSWDHYRAVAARLLQHVVSRDRERGRGIANAASPDEEALLAAQRLVRTWKRSRLRACGLAARSATR